MASVTEMVKESLVGTELDTGEPSTQTRTTFTKYAKTDPETGETYMDRAAFIDAVAPEDEDYHKIKRDTYGILFEIADRRRKDRVTLQDWNVFAGILAKPDAEYQMAFRLFASPTSGLVDFDEFKEMYAENVTGVPFDWNGKWVTLYMGDKRNRHSMTYPQFSQMLRGLQGERVRQAFLHYDQKKSGYITPEQFQQIIKQTFGHKLSDHLLQNLPSLCNISSGADISYANVRAFTNIIKEMDLVELIIRSAIAKSADSKITRGDFLTEAARITRFSHYTPMEADILFHFGSLDQPSGRLGLEDFGRVLDASWHGGPNTFGQIVEASRATSIAEQRHASSESWVHDVLISAHHFLLGSIAGAFGAFMVYPIDLVKTRMQNQRSGRVGSTLYKNSLDCFQKVIRNEGFLGLYSGVLPQLVGVAPEKAIKLTVNDLVRGKFTDVRTGAIPTAAEVLAGGSAGMCQVIFTNPLEIVKIRLQIQGEAAKAAARDGETFNKRTAVWIVRNLGLKGLYKGASACLLRDIPFSAIYFPTYSHLKKDVFGESPTKKLGILQLLTAGAIAGMPAAYLTTPFDVIKTRLQVEARKGDTAYTGLRDAAQKIFKEEGFKAFFRGGPARVLRSSPQFGFTLAGYEVLQNMLPMPGEAVRDVTPPDAAAGLQETRAPLPYLRSRNALKIILDLDLGFGRYKPAEKAKEGQKSGSVLGALGLKKE